MAKRIILTEISNLVIQIQLNVRGMKPDAKSEEIVYFPAVVSIKGKAIGSDVALDIEDSLTLGEPKKTPFTPKEIYAMVKSKFGNEIAEKIKGIYLKGINEEL